MIFGRGRHSSFILAVRSISKIPKFLQSIVFAIWRASAFKLPLLCAVNRHLQLQIHSYAWDWVSERASERVFVQMFNCNGLIICAYQFFILSSRVFVVRNMYMFVSCTCQSAFVLIRLLARAIRMRLEIWRSHGKNIDSAFRECSTVQFLALSCREAHTFDFLAVFSAHRTQNDRQTKEVLLANFM